MRPSSRGGTGAVRVGAVVITVASSLFSLDPNLPPMNPINGSGRNHLRLHLLILLVLSASLASTPVGGEHVDDGNKNKRGPSFIERAIGVSGLDSRWDAVRTWAQLAWMNLRPPDASYGQSGSSGTGAMKEAATKSFETSKEAMEAAAASAAKVAGEAVEKTTKTLKGGPPSGETENSAEL